MPISFACPCGKDYTVADAFAGKRTKCAACAAPLTVPAPPAADAEAAAFALLADGPDPAASPAGRRAWEADPNAPLPPRPPVAVPKPAAKTDDMKKAMKALAKEERASRLERGGGITVTSGVVFGLLTMLGAAAWFGLGYAAGRIYVYAPILFVIGLVRTVSALAGHEE